MKTNFGNLVILLTVCAWLSYRGTISRRLLPVYAAALAFGFFAITFWR